MVGSGEKGGGGTRGDSPFRPEQANDGNPGTRYDNIYIFDEDT